MMGGELCINATLAYAKSLGLQQGELLLEGDGSVRYKNATRTEIELSLPYRLFRTKDGTNMVLFDGIGYEVGMTLEGASRRKDELPKLCEEFDLPAFGFIVVPCRQDKIKPLVYVVETNSYVWETACGSGSVAYYIVKYGFRTDTPLIRVTQPSGGEIYVRQRCQMPPQIFSISAEVEEITLNRGDRI